MDDLFELLDEDEEIEVKKPAKKEAVKKPEEKKEPKPVDVKKYRYPFIMYYAAQNIDVSHIFEEGKEYTADEITSAMLAHQFYEFSGKVSYDLIEADNVLVPTFQQHKKG
ncbi:MAG TPA: hypothetical protein DCM01_05510 [Dielma fastidiosa]|nr:hypothetical protein [Dielma fastidiosa]